MSSRLIEMDNETFRRIIADAVKAEREACLQAVNKERKAAKHHELRVGLAIAYNVIHARGKS